MQGIIPSISDVRQRLARESTADLKRLAQASGVPFTTLWKLRSGETSNPGIETVRKFYPLLLSTPPSTQEQPAHA